MLEKYMNFSLYTKALLINGCILTAVTSLIVFFHISRDYQNKEQELQKRLVELSVLQAESVASSLWDLNREKAHQILTSLTQREDFISVVLTDEHERIFSEIKKDLPEGDQFIEHRLPVNIKLNKQVRCIGQLSLRLSTLQLQEDKQEAMSQSLLIWFLQLLAILLATAWGLKNLMRPLTNITNSMLLLSKDHLNEEVPELHRRDKLGEMAQAVEVFRNNALEKEWVKNELQRKNSFLIAQQEASLDGILIVNTAGKMASFNKRFVEMWTIPSDIVESRSNKEFLTHILGILSDHDYYISNVNFLEKHRESTKHDEISLIDGRTFELYSAPVRGEDDQNYGRIWNFRDITKHKEIEQSIRNEQLKKIESLKTMAGAIAHRFNNAMMAVQGNLELMKCTLPADSDEYKMAFDAAKAANGASLVGSMMLTYVGQQPLKLQEIFLETLVRECVTTLKNLLRPSISLQFTPPDKPLYCSIDQKQIKEVIESILTNAIEALGDGTGAIQITFGTDYFKTDSFPVNFQNDHLKDGNYDFCQIKDSGHGINPEDISRIFEPFFTTRFVGRGLGLALTVGIMQSHHGAITVESVLDQGTTIRVMLPSISSTQQMIPSDDDSQGEAVKLSGNILLVDDEEMVLDVARKMLEMLGFTVHTAMDGRKAVDKIRGNDIKFCAVVLDISMPEMDGIEAMNVIRAINPALPILLSSGSSEDDFPFKKGEGNKPNGFLSKPFQLSVMRSHLEKILS